MSFFAVRDDDTSAFTKPEELESVYARYWKQVPISLAIVPFPVPDYRSRKFSSDYSCDENLPVGKNTALVGWLREKIQENEIEVMLHGYSHEYRRVNDRWVGEFGWKDEVQLVENVLDGKCYLEELLNTRIRVFVPPSNAIGRSGINAIREAGLDLSGVMGRGGDRPVSRDYPAAYLRRWLWRLRYGTPYPYVLRYGGHAELCAYALTPKASRDGLMDALENCKKCNAPFVLATHYWEFKENKSMHDILAQLIDRASELQMEFVPVSRCFEYYDEA